MAVKTAQRGYLTEVEVAQQLGLAPRTLTNWRCVGKGPRFTRIGRQIRYAPADVQAWIAAQNP